MTGRCVTYVLVGVVEHPHGRGSGQAGVGCCPQSYLWGAVPAESLHQFECRFRVIGGELAHAWVRVLGVAQEAVAGEVRVAAGVVGVLDEECDQVRVEELAFP